MQRTQIKETKNCVNQKVKVCGWVQTVRSHGKILFVDLRDRSGILQVVFTPKDEKLYELSQKLRPEWVILVEGEIQKRPAGMINPKIETGSIELQSEKLEVYSEAKTLPFAIDTPGYEINEEKRLKYRYLDLRRERLRKNLDMRQKVIHFIRNFLIERRFYRNGNADFDQIYA